jgi:hypothetical protein
MSSSGRRAAAGDVEARLWHSMRFKLVFARDPIDVVIASLQQCLDAARIALLQMLQKVRCNNKEKPAQYNCYTSFDRISLNCWHDCDSRFSLRSRECAEPYANSADRADAFQLHIHSIQPPSLCVLGCLQSRTRTKLKVELEISASKTTNRSHFYSFLFFILVSK